MSRTFLFGCALTVLVLKGIDAAPYRTPKICIVHVTNQDESGYGSLPWPRSFHANILTQIEEAGADWVVFKSLIDSPGIAYDDQKLINVCAKYENVLLPSVYLLETSTAPWDSALLHRFKIKDKTQTTKFLDFPNCLIPFDPLARASAGIGNINVKTKGRKLVGVPLVVRIQGDLYPSLPLLTVLKVLNVSFEDVIAQDGSLLIGEQAVSMDPEGMMELKLTPPGQNYKSYSYTDIMNGHYKRKDLHGNIVVVGYAGKNHPVTFETEAALDHNVIDITADAIQCLLSNLDHPQSKSK